MFSFALGDKLEADRDFDLAMTEIENGFVIESASDKGRQTILALRLEPATCAQTYQAEQKIKAIYGMQEKTLPPIAQIEKALTHSYDYPQWDDVASRCLAVFSHVLLASVIQKKKSLV